MIEDSIPSVEEILDGRKAELGLLGTTLGDPSNRMVQGFDCVKRGYKTAKNFSLHFVVELGCRSNACRLPGSSDVFFKAELS